MNNTIRNTNTTTSSTIKPVLPVSFALRVNWFSRPDARRSEESVRSIASSVSSRRADWASSSEAMLIERECWRAMAEESESRVSSWSARGGGVAEGQGELHGRKRAWGRVRTVEHAALHLEYFGIGPAHLVFVLLELVQCCFWVAARHVDCRVRSATLDWS